MRTALVARFGSGGDDISGYTVEEWKSLEVPRATKNAWKKAFAAHMATVQEMLLKDRTGNGGTTRSNTNCWESTVTQAEEYLMEPG